MAFNTQDLVNKYKGLLSKTGNTLSSFVQQNPTPASYIVPKVGNYVANKIQGTISPLQVNPIKQPVQALPLSILFRNLQLFQHCPKYIHGFFANLKQNKVL